MFIIDILFIASPLFGFIPQIYKNEVTYKPFLSLINIMTAIIKIFDWFYKKYDKVIFIQNFFIIFLHLLLVHNNKIKTVNRYGFEDNKFFYILKRISALIFLLFILDNLKLSFMFNYLALFLDVFTTYAHFIVYREDPQKPIELFAVWILGDFIKIYFNVFVYKTPTLYTLAVFTQLFFDLLTVFTQAKMPLDMEYY